MASKVQSFGDLLRGWRERRRISQLSLASEAEISTKHLSFLETGRSAPSREMVLRLARVLEVPLRERNLLLHAAGFAAAFRECRLEDSALSTARRAVELVLRGHEPYPALAIDRHWQLLAANAALPPLLSGVHPQLMKAPINVLRLSLHPEGLAGHIRNLGAWKAHVIERLKRQIEVTGDAQLQELLEELLAYPAPAVSDAADGDDHLGGVAVPLELVTVDGVLALLSTTTVFGTPREVTLSELALESFFPADERTAEILRTTAARRGAKTGSGTRAA